MTELLLGAGIGLAAGLSPGPLLALVVTNTLRRGFAAGALVALAPLVTDVPIIVATLLVVDAVPTALLRGLALGGAAYLIWLAIDTLRREPVIAAGDLRQGVTTNLLSPHPWLFWLGAGAPILATAWDRAPGRGVAFVAGFYGLLIGTKLVVAALVAVARRQLVERYYRVALVASAGLLLAAAGLLLGSVVLAE